MTNDELITRLDRVEANCKLQEALTMCLLPAIDPTRRHLVLQQYRQMCQSLEVRMTTEKAEPAVAELELGAAAALYTKLEAALEVIEQHERRMKS